MPHVPTRCRCYAVQPLLFTGATPMSSRVHMPCAYAARRRRCASAIHRCRFRPPAFRFCPPCDPLICCPMLFDYDAIAIFAHSHQMPERCFAATYPSFGAILRHCTLMPMFSHIVRWMLMPLRCQAFRRSLPLRCRRFRFAAMPVTSPFFFRQRHVPPPLTRYSPLKMLILPI